jgi:hypothetical protein
MKSSALKISSALVLGLVMLLAANNARSDVSVSGHISASAGFDISAGISISGGVVVAPPPPPPVVIAPAPVVVAAPPVVVQPAPAVIVVPAPKPVLVVEQPAPPPPKVVIKAPPYKPAFEKQFGFGLKLGGAFFNGVESPGHEGMGGAGLLLRLRLLPHFATEIGVDAYGGHGYDGVKRVEVPITIGFMWMPVPYKWRVQFYTIGGMGTAFARVGEEPYQDRPIYLGGFLGVGLELKLGPNRNFALFADLRGFMRKRMNDRPDDPLVPTGGSCRDDGFGGIECTDWEGGLVGNFGVVFYF